MTSGRNAGVAGMEEFDAVLMRKDPPFDMEYIYSTYLLELAEGAGARVYNRPRAVRDHNEKLAIAKYPEYTAPTLVTRQADVIREFLAEHHDIILKPLDGMGGTSIFRVREADPNVNVILEIMTQDGTRSAMAQRFIPAISEGDKRILLIAGEPVPYALARIPKEGESRGNLAAAGAASRSRCPRTTGTSPRRSDPASGPRACCWSASTSSART
jgi:glutathione synthase